MKKGLKVLIVIVVVLAVIGVGIFFYFKAPDMKPLASYFGGGASFYKVNDKGHYDTPPTISAQVKQAISQDRVKYEAVIQKNDTREAQIVSQLKTAGVTVGGAYIVDNDAGEQMLGLNIPFTGSILDSSSFMTSAANALVKLADIKTLDLSGLAYVNMFITDTENRIIFGVTAKASDIQDYRAGKLNLERFFAKTAARVESRSGALDAVSGGLK
jgi:hypothetical protein